MWAFQCAAGDTAVELFEEMKKLGVVPDRITFTGLVSATTAAGKWETAQSFIDMMEVSFDYYMFFMVRQL
jgi:hypothetical protein